jgi:hypothetical protein
VRIRFLSGSPRPCGSGRRQDAKRVCSFPPDIYKAQLEYAIFDLYDGFYEEWANQNAKKVPEIAREAIAVRKYQKEFSPQRNGDLDGFAVCLASLGGLCEAIVSGKPSFEHVYGESFFEYLGRRPQDASVFNRAMTNATSGNLPAILAAYDFSRFGKIVDVGGGQGALLRGILERCPDATGVLCDVPSLVAQATEIRGQQWRTAVISLVRTCSNLRLQVATPIS